MTLLNFLHHLFDKTNYMTIFENQYFIHKKTHTICIQPAIFRDKYISYLKENSSNEPYDFKYLKRKLLELGIKRKQLKVRDSVTLYYMFDDNDIPQNL